MIAISEETKTKILNTPIYEGMFFSISRKDRIQGIYESTFHFKKKAGYVIYTYPKKIKNLFSGVIEKVNIYIPSSEESRYTEDQLQMVGEHLEDFTRMIEHRASATIFKIYKDNRYEWKPKLVKYFRDVVKGTPDQVSYWMYDLDENTFYDFTMMDFININVDNGIAYLRIHLPWNSVVLLPFYYIPGGYSLDMEDYIIER